MSFQDGEGMARWKQEMQEMLRQEKQGKEVLQKDPLIDKLLPLCSKQGKAGGLNHEEITLILYIVYIVSK